MARCEWCGKPINQEQVEQQDGLCDSCTEEPAAEVNY